MEHQLLEFLRDPGFLAQGELIYVIDDPSIRADVLFEADRLYHLYQIPMRIVASPLNRGFSGANNLGAEHAKGEYLLFLNSDVIPIEPGWLEHLIAAFDEEAVGVVGARLLSADGGIQHAGMDFDYLDRFGIWRNIHPGAGLAPEFDGRELRDVRAVTGACLIIPRSVFDQIGGWNMGYLLGDFEDSDLCLAARNAGYRVLYQPLAELTHLERQSFSGMADDAFRLRMTICNAVRHQARWRDEIEAPFAPGPAATVPSARDMRAQA
ncbi:glycosyltransferase family 2 protein [Pararhodobacter sp. SW119]|uniref:glycosyltransferase n=1 Tax=Pararhodobacter sp. SW119 TaxID=2780075 RepID=UPI001FD7BBDA|nr:glycosyltransferase family 2 protein [Pararhodobacter sp. SW119]